MSKVRLPITDDGFIVPQLGHVLADNDPHIELSSDAAASILDKYFSGGKGQMPKLITMAGREFDLSNNAAISDFTAKVKALPAVVATMERLKVAGEAGLDGMQVGFVNNHTSDDLDGKGDKKWYLFGGSKVRHKGDDLMTKAEAVAAGIEIG